MRNDPEAQAAYEATLAAIDARKAERLADLGRRVDDAFDGGEPVTEEGEAP